MSTSNRKSLSGALREVHVLAWTLRKHSKPVSHLQWREKLEGNLKIFKFMCVHPSVKCVPTPVEARRGFGITGAGATGV